MANGQVENPYLKMNRNREVEVAAKEYPPRSRRAPLNNPYALPTTSQEGVEGITGIYSKRGESGKKYMEAGHLEASP